MIWSDSRLVNESQNTEADSFWCMQYPAVDVDVDVDVDDGDNDDMEGRQATTEVLQALHDRFPAFSEPPF